MGTVVWDIVATTVRNAGSRDRVTFMLDGLSATFLEGIARQAPNQGQDVAGRSLLLAINVNAAEHLEIRHPARPTTESAIHWRHSKEAEVILFAPADGESEGIGAGLGPMSLINDRRIIEQASVWLAELNEVGPPESYLEAMLEGLRLSGISIDLEMWTDFIISIQDQGFALPVDARIQNAVPALRIPREGITKLPSFKAHLNSTGQKQAFRRAFFTAGNEVGAYVGLMTPKQEPVDVDAVRTALDDYSHPDQKDREVAAALDAVRALLDDAPNIRPGEWRQSQQEFCELVPWDSIGSQLFAGGIRTTKETLGRRTLYFIEGDYGDDVTDEDRQLLENLKDSIPKDPKEEEIEFFARWQERLSHPNAVKLYKNWQRRLFSKEVIGNDLLSAISEGFEALIIAGAGALAEIECPRVQIRAGKHNKATYWQSLDARVHKLFRFELNSVIGLFGDSVIWDLGSCFESEAMGDSNSADSRRVELEFYLVEKSDVVDLIGAANPKSPPRSSPRVRVIWQPGTKPRDEPIGLSLPDDINALAQAAKTGSGVFRRQVFAHRDAGDNTRLVSTTLRDINSFSDVAQAQNGRTFDTSILTKDDVLAKIRESVDNLEASHGLEAEAAMAIRQTVDRFQTAYKAAILAIAGDPRTGFADRSVRDQANAFGDLCRSCRRHAISDKAKKLIRPLVAGIGIVRSDGTDMTDAMAILAAWHPLRLAERRAKIRGVAEFVESVLESSAAKNADLAIAFEERRSLLEPWVFPETALIGNRTMIAVEHVAGYSLLVPSDCTSLSQEALEESAPLAADKLIEGVNQYIEIYAHEASNLSAAILDSESHSLPRAIASRLAERIHRDPDLRCDLVITHRDQERLRDIYRSQNLRLGTENVSETAKGFLSRLRVDVKPNRATSRDKDDVREIDLALLHDAVSRYAVTRWDHEDGDTASLDPEFRLSAMRNPRRKPSGVDSLGVGNYLALPRPPRAVAEYHDLLYEMSKSAVLPAGSHAVLVQSVEFDRDGIRDLITRAHDLAKWIVTYDKVSCRPLLEDCGVRIIRDISVPGSGGHAVISASRIDRGLKENVRRDLIDTLGFNAETAVGLGDAILADVLRVSGQKVMSAARFENASREIVGLSLMRAYLEACLARDRFAGQGPIWVSLDDYRNWFMSGKGKVADAVGVTVQDMGSRFELNMLVGEAKYSGKSNERAAVTAAWAQVRDTVDRLRRILIDNADSISRQAWCRRLAELLVNREGLSRHLRDPKRCTAFVDDLVSGNVTFRIKGDAVVSIHDDQVTRCRTEDDEDNPHLRVHILPRPEIRRILGCLARNELPETTELLSSKWYSSNSVAEHAEDEPTELNSSGSPVNPPSPEQQQVPGSIGTTEVSVGDISEAESGLRHTDEARSKEISRSGLHETEQPIGEDKAHSAFQNTSGVHRHIPAPVLNHLEVMAERESEAVDDEESMDWADQVCTETQRALSSFGMQAHFAEPRFRLTPNGALITFKGHHTLTEGKLDKKRGELLTTYGIEAVDVRPGRGTLSLFVKREVRAKVPLASTWMKACWPDLGSEDCTSFVIGAREDDDKLLYLNLAEAFAGYERHGPHTLIAGETGSGKGILIQNLLLQLITFFDPGSSEIVLVDPKKGVDFTWLKGAPHLKREIVDDISTAQHAFSELVSEMDRRYERFAQSEVQNISYYNRVVQPEERMSRIFLFHDELGSWLAEDEDYRSTILSSVNSLGMKARAAGIHLILITQRADARAVPTPLRDNMGNRLCLRVQNDTGSRMVLNTRGAERLLGRGHLACVLTNQNPPPGQGFFVVQVPFAEPHDMKQLADAAKAFWRGRAQ